MKLLKLIPIYILIIFSKKIGGGVGGCKGGSVIVWLRSYGGS